MVKYSQAFGLRRDGFRAMRWYLFLTPIILAILLFMAYPAGESLRLSFMKSNGIRSGRPDIPTALPIRVGFLLPPLNPS